MASTPPTDKPNDLNPLLTNGKVVTDLLSEVIRHRLSKQDIHSIAQSVYHQNAQDFGQELSEMLLRISELLEVARLATDTDTLDQLFDLMVELVIELLHVERCTIFLHNPLSDTLFSHSTQGDTKQEIRFPSHLGIAGAVFLTGKTETIKDVHSDSRFHADIDLQTGFTTQSILCTPIQTASSGIIGVIQALNKQEGPFTPQDATFLEAMALVSAKAFVTARLCQDLERARKEESQLLAVTTAVSRELNLKPLLTMIMNSVTQILDADRSTLFLHEPRTDELWSEVAQGIDRGEIRFPSHLGIAGSVFSTGKTINIPDAYADPRFNPEIDQKTGYRTFSILCMPIDNKRGARIGVIQVLNKSGGPFKHGDERRLEAFASQAAVAIENARLFEDILRAHNDNRRIVESMADGVISISPDGTIFHANQTARTLFGIPDDDSHMIDTSAEEFFSGANDWVVQEIEQVARTGHSETFTDVEFHLFQPDSTTTKREGIVASINLTVVPLQKDRPSDPRPGTLLIIEDITDEKRVQSTLARYVPSEVAKKLIQEGDDALGGRLQRATILFSDIDGFTALSESLGPQETVRLLNDYFALMVEILHHHGGLLDKFIGDGILAVFGVPYSAPDDADRAASCAVEMLRAVDQFNQERSHLPISIRIGLNTDEIVSGNIGSQRRMNYTVVGDGVNVASRLEVANKIYGTRILLSQSTAEGMNSPPLMREVDRLRVRGRKQPVRIYEILEPRGTHPLNDPKSFLPLYEKARNFLKKRSWNKALQSFQEAAEIAPEDPITKLYIQRCQGFIHSPPDPQWDGVWNAEDSPG
ncbi:MAG: GAF domain-containing protein [Planctomycetota bacterium]|nr:GAF domain-containing protein [Planctomycetota bacterium]